MLELLVAVLMPPEKDDRSSARRFSAQSLYDSGLHSIGRSNGFVGVQKRSLNSDQAFGLLPLRLSVFA
jgi:hypothetical protein